MYWLTHSPCHYFRDFEELKVLHYVVHLLIKKLVVQPFYFYSSFYVFTFQIFCLVICKIHSFLNLPTFSVATTVFSWSEFPSVEFCFQPLLSPLISTRRGLPSFVILFQFRYSLACLGFTVSETMSSGTWCRFYKLERFPSEQVRLMSDSENQFYMSQIFFRSGKHMSSPELVFLLALVLCLVTRYRFWPRNELLKWSLR